MVYTFNDARAIEFAEEVLTRFDRLQEMGIGHPSIFLSG